MEAGKRLAAISRQAKEIKILERVQIKSMNKDESTFTIPIIIAAACVVVGGGLLYKYYYSKEIKTEEPQQQQQQQQQAQPKPKPKPKRKPYTLD